MKAVKLKRELKETFEQLRRYKEENSDNEIQIAYLTMKTKYLMEQINSASVAVKILSKTS